MTSLSEVDIDTIIERLTPARVRAFQILQVGLVLGIMVMLVMILFLFGLGRETIPGEFSDERVRGLSMLVAIMVLVALIVGQLMYRRLLSPARIRDYASRPLGNRRSGIIDDPAEKVLTLMQQAMLVRLCIYDIPVLFGLVVCLTELVSGVIFAYPQYMLITIPAFAQLAFLAVTFPTRERLIRIAREKVLQAR